MSGLAEIFLNMGCRVTGSDLKKSALTDRLRRHGARIFIGHRADHMVSPQVVVTSSAVLKSNPEVEAAIKKGIPVIARGEMLAELMRLKYGIAVAGSHGKTTTTSLVGSVLTAGGLDPTLVIGGRVRSLRSNARLGKGEFLVAEADESDGSFMHLTPTVAVITNIDREHLDHYRDFAALEKTFEEFAQKIPFYGAAVFCADHPLTASLAKRFSKRCVTYGIKEKADCQAVSIRLKGWESSFDVKYRGQNLGRIRLHIPGMHNVLNSLAAIAVGCELGIRFADIRKGLHSFRGIARRLEIILKKSVTIVDDYGHHPEEIRTTLKAVRVIHPKGRLWVLFQPHRFTRTKYLFHDFVGAFAPVDHLIITDIYAAGEEPIQGINSEALVAAIKKKKNGLKPQKVEYSPHVSGLASAVFPRLQPGDLVLTLGAGDIYKVGKELAQWIQE